VHSQAEFSDGTVTSKAWSTFVVTHGPTAASVTAGCAADNLDPCVVSTTAEPVGWHEQGFTEDAAAWSNATEFTAAVAGWGRSWSTTSFHLCISSWPLCFDYFVIYYLGSG
jgi:hypothetical protein